MKKHLRPDEMLLWKLRCQNREYAEIAEELGEGKTEDSVRMQMTRLTKRVLSLPEVIRFMEDHDLSSN